MEPATPPSSNTDSVSLPKNSWHAPLNKVTILSKLTAAVVFITLPFVGFWVGWHSSPTPDPLILEVPQYDHTEKPSMDQNGFVIPELVTETTSTKALGHIVAISSTTLTIDLLEERSEAAKRLIDTTFVYPDGEVDTLMVVSILHTNLLSDPQPYSFDLGTISLSYYSGEPMSFSELKPAAVTPNGLLQGQLYEFSVSQDDKLESVVTVHGS